jgi:hypothetical protein
MDEMMSLMRWPDMDASKWCTATAKRTGQRRARACLPGSNVCRMHSAGASQVVAAADRREADRKVRELPRRWTSTRSVQRRPYASLRSLLARDQAEFARFGRLVDGLEDSGLKHTSRSGIEPLRAELAAYRAERDSMGRRLDLLLRADVAGHG